MGKNYYEGCDDFMHMENYYDRMIEKNFKDNEEKIKGDFKAKIKNLQNFYEDMNKKYDFKNLNKNDLHKRLIQMNTRYKTQKTGDNNSFMKKETPFISIGF